MQHGICKALLFSTLHDDNDHSNSLTNFDSTYFNNRNSPQELLRVIVFVVASLSIMGFPFLAGFITKTWIKYDLPFEARLIYTTASLLTSTVYARLIFDRVSVFIKRQNLNQDTPFDLEIALNDLFSKPKNYLLILSTIFLVCSSLLFPELLTLGSIQSAVVSAILGGILFVSVVGIQADDFVKPVTRTLDLVGAPFLVAALLLANLLYLKI